MIRTALPASIRRAAHPSVVSKLPVYPRCIRNQTLLRAPSPALPTSIRARQHFFHTSPLRRAQGPTADALMENLNDLYATAKDEFEIAAEETEKKTVYAEEDRAGAREALQLLTEAYQKATTESDPEVAREVQSRVGARIRELENAVTAMEESALED